VLDLYAEEPDPQRPVVCFDESPTQLIGETRQPIPPEPGKPGRYDCEYRRNGTANLFVFLAMRTAPGARSRSPTSVPPPTSHAVCGTWSIRTVRYEIHQVHRLAGGVRPVRSGNSDNHYIRNSLRHLKQTRTVGSCRPAAPRDRF
jgi:hypothetical protein